MSYLVNTPCGPVQGVKGKYKGTAAYKGIRYATAGRWEYPQLVTGWEGIYDATRYGNCSYQPRAFYDEEQMPEKAFYYNEFRKGETYTYSEDCLFLNIFAPDTAKEGDSLPVLVYIHGGGYTGGCGFEKHFDQPIWPTRGVIGVTINYRLGPMGFVCLPELAAEAGHTGNYGLFDQVAALQWVKANIASFGGDPDHITIMGQSAGAMSVQQLCLSPLTDNLFCGAVMSSGGGVSKMMSPAPAKKRYDFWQQVMANAGCDDLQSFRALPPKDLFDAWQTAKQQIKGSGMYTSPVLDGVLITDSGVDIVSRGEHKNIAYMAGSTSQDIMPPIICSMAKDWCATQRKPAYTWFFDRSLPGDDNGAWHSSDLWYWFGTLENCWRPMEDKDYALSEQMVDYLCNFAKTGDPNGKGLPLWQPQRKAGKKVLRLGEKDTHMGSVSTAKLVYTMMTNKAVGA